jgi:hypothetical protein
MFIPEDYIEKMRKVFQPNSIKTMNTQIKRIHILGGEKSFSRDFLQNFSKIKELIYKNLDKTSVRKAMVNTIIKVLTVGGGVDDKSKIMELYTGLFKEMITEHNKNYLYAENDKKLLNMKEVKNIFKEYQKQVLEFDKDKRKTREYYLLFQKYLILALYTIIPPLRGEEYYNSIVEECDKKILEKCIENRDYNFYDPKSGNLVVKKYKTMRKYGTRIIKFPPRLMKIINEWLEIKENYLGNKNNKKLFNLSQQAFTETLFAIFTPFKISTSALRKIYISSCVKGMNGKKRQEIARIMGHSLEMQEFVYKKKI